MRIPQFTSTNEAITYGFGVYGVRDAIAEMKRKLEFLDKGISIAQELRVCDNHLMKTYFNRQVLREALETAEGVTQVTYLKYIPAECLFFDF